MTDKTADKQESRTAEVPHELQIVKQIWRRAYLDSEEDHVKILKEYAESYAQQRVASLEERLKAAEGMLKWYDLRLELETGEQHPNFKNFFRDEVNR